MLDSRASGCSAVRRSPAPIRCPRGRMSIACPHCTCPFEPAGAPGSVAVCPHCQKPSPVPGATPASDPALGAVPVPAPAPPKHHQWDWRFIAGTAAIVLTLAVILPVVVVLLRRQPGGEAIPVDANTLFGDFARDHTAASHRYTGKTLHVTGRVSLVNKEGTPVLTMRTEPFGSVYCEFMRSAELAAVRAGDQVTVRGICIGRRDPLVPRIALLDCTLIPDR